MEESKTKVNVVKINTTPIYTESYGLGKNIYEDLERAEISTKHWKQTFRKTNQNEVLNLIKDTTITQSSLIRFMGNYSTKMYSKLNMNNKVISNIEDRPSKLFYREEVNITQALNNDMLSYIPYALNYLSSLEEDTNNKMYLDNFALLDDNLYFTLFLTSDVSIEAECMVLEKEDILTNYIQTLTDDSHLKIFVTDMFNYQSAEDMLKANLNQDFIMMSLNKSFKFMYLSIYTEDTKVQLSKQNLLALTKVQQTYKDAMLYATVKGKYEFDRKNVG